MYPSLREEILDKSGLLTEDMLEEGWLKKAAMTALFSAAALASLFAGGIKKANQGATSVTKDMAVKIEQKLDEIGKNYNFWIDKDTGVGYLAIRTNGNTKESADSFAQNTVKQFCKENNIDINKWNFQEAQRGFYDPATKTFYTVYQVTKDAGNN